MEYAKPIESVRGGHVGGVNNKNIFAWELNFFPKENSFIVLLLQHGRRAHTLLSNDHTQLLDDLADLSVCARKSWKKCKRKKLIWFQCTAIISKILPQVGAVKFCLKICKIVVTLFGLRDFPGFLALIRVASWRPRCWFMVSIDRSCNLPNQFPVSLFSACDNSLILYK